MTERQNIRRLQTPERRREDVLFDAKRELTEHDWANLATTMDEDGERSNWIGVAESAALAHIIDPKREVLTKREKYILANEYRDALATAPDDPVGRSDKIDLVGNTWMRDAATRRGVSEAFVQSLRNDIEDQRQTMGGDKRLFLQTNLFLRLVRPNEYITNVDLAAFLQTTLDKTLKEARSPINIETLALGRALGFDVQVPDDYLDAIRSGIKHLRNSNLSNKTDLIFALAMAGQILAADEVRISVENGLELIHNKKDGHEKSSPPEPETLAI